jgi:hypothetical protein
VSSKLRKKQVYHLNLEDNIVQHHTGFVRGGDDIGGGVWSGEGRGRCGRVDWRGSSKVRQIWYYLVSKIYSLKGIDTVSGFQKLVTWLTQTLAIWDQFGLATNLETYESFKESPRMKVLEVPNSPWIQGFISDGPCEASNTIYWPESLYFGVTTHSC